jgi:hypothetical protein
MKREVILVIVFTLLLPIISASEPNNFSTTTMLDSGVMVSGSVTESDGDNPEDLYQIQVSPGDTIQIRFTSNEADFCIYMGVNGTEELDCFYEGALGDAGDVELFERKSTEYYFFKIDCGSTALDCSPSTEYTLKVIIHPDEAGDSLNEAKYLLPEVRVEGWAALDEQAEPIDFDYYRTPVIEEDTIRFIIGSNDMTSYRLYDHYGIKISEGYEAGSYDFAVDVDYTGDLFIELFCVQNGLQPCDYSLIAIGSTYTESSSDGDEALEDSLSPATKVIIALLIVVLIIKRKTSPNREIVQSNHHQKSETLGLQNESVKVENPDISERKNIPTVVQNITYNIQDSAISGDISTNLNIKDE